jgi:hypothetical protein
VRQTGECNREHAGPARMIIPSRIYNNENELRDLLQRDVPPEALRRLLPMVWNDPWGAMKPFLLI